jgi:hypothetical protein
MGLNFGLTAKRRDFSAGLFNEDTQLLGGNLTLKMGF